jgi:hypothetical protein
MCLFVNMNNLYNIQSKLIFFEFKLIWFFTIINTNIFVIFAFYKHKYIYIYLR